MCSYLYVKFRLNKMYNFFQQNDDKSTDNHYEDEDSDDDDVDFHENHFEVRIIN